MAGNWQREEDERRRRRANEFTEEDAVDAATAVAMIAGTGFLLYKGLQWFTSGSETKEEVPPSRQLSEEVQEPVTYGCAFPDAELSIDQADKNHIVIAVDATKQRAGGILLLPKSKSIYFYSINWSNVFSFPDEPDKFEMVNALLALEIFEDYVTAYRTKYPYDALCLKTDNTFCTTSRQAGPYSGLRNEEYRKLFLLIDKKLKTVPFRGNWMNSHRQTDVHLKIADRLSRHDNSTSDNIQYPIGHADPFPDYTEQNISETDYAALHTVALHVPFALKRT